jgi:hypothetical protein
MTIIFDRNERVKTFRFWIVFYTANYLWTQYKYESRGPKKPWAGIAKSFQIEYEATIKRKVNLNGMGAL